MVNGSPGVTKAQVQTPAEATNGQKLRTFEPAHSPADTPTDAKPVYRTYRRDTGTKRKCGVINYNDLNNFSSVVLYDTTPTNKRKFYEVERIITRRKRKSGQISLSNITQANRND